MEEQHPLIPPSFEDPPGLADQVIILLSTFCFRDLDNLMGEGDWVAALLSSYPRTKPARSAWKPLLLIRCQIDNTPRVSDLQTSNLLEAEQSFQAQFEVASQMLDGICNGEHEGQKATLLQREIRRFIIPACVAIIKAVFDGTSVGEGEERGFTRTSLELASRALDWIYKLNRAVVGGVEAAAGDRERLEKAVEPLWEGILGAMTDVLREESSGGKMEYRVKGENVEEVEDTRLDEVPCPYMRAHLLPPQHRHLTTTSRLCSGTITRLQQTCKRKLVRFQRNPCQRSGRGVPPTPSIRLPQSVPAWTEHLNAHGTDLTCERISRQSHPKIQQEMDERLRPWPRRGGLPGSRGSRS